RVPVQALQRRGTPRRTESRTSREVNTHMIQLHHVNCASHTISSPFASGSLEVISMADIRSIVFVVDDDVSVRESLELLITSAGWQPELFGSAHEFLSHPRTAVPSCLVLDVSLPGLDGLELQRQLTDRTETPIVFITGHGDVPMSVRAMKAGAVE